MKKLIASVLVGAMVLSFAACGDGTGDSAGGNQGNTGNTQNTGQTTGGSNGGSADANGLVDGKFAETRHITVEVYDRNNDGGTDPTNNMYTDYIKQGMLDTYNVEVEFVAIDRWEEVNQINNLLAASNAPDICLTYDYPTIQQYADMGGVQDLSGYVEDYKALLPHLWAWLGEDNIYYDKDPNTGTIWALEGKRANIRRINTFVRKDWLEKLDIPAPTTLEEFENMLVAFKDNAQTLLGADADKMVPFSISTDVGWRAANLIESFIDPNITDKEFYINGFDDRKFTENGTKEAIRVLNRWYNDGLLWEDFAIHDGDSVEDDMIKAGYVGAFIHSWDYPYQPGNAITTTLKEIVGPEADYIAIDCFKNAAGKYAKYSYSAAGDRKIFFPTTNDEPLASLLYLDWISDPAHIEYLQIGEEGHTHEVLEGGVIAVMAAEAPYIQNSGQNIDLTITCNGLNLSSEDITLKSMANNYSGSDADIVLIAMQICLNDSILPQAVNVGVIESEAGVGNGLSKKRDVALNKAIVASVADFDKEWDKYMADYMSAGGQAIKDERQAKWEATYGTADMLP